MIVVIHACESGAAKDAYDKLPASKKNKISLFWSSGKNQKSYKSNASKFSVYGHTIVQLMGYDGTVYADLDGNGGVSVKELGESINNYIDDVSKYYDAPLQTPGYCSSSNMNTVFFVNRLVTLNKEKVTIYTGESIKLKGKDLKGTVSLKWKSSNARVASVSSNGKVTGKKAGVTTITLRTNNGFASCKVTVKNPSIKLNKSKITLYTYGKKTVKLLATVDGPSSKIKWISNKKSVATVNSKGLVRAKSAGKAVITATANGKKVKCTITVKAIKPSISLNKKKITLYTSGKVSTKLNAIVKGPSLKVSWTSNNTKVATVTKVGKIIAKSPGKATITATANGLTAKCIVTVKKAQPNKDLRGRYFSCQSFDVDQKIHFYKQKGKNYDSVMEFWRDGEVTKVFYSTTPGIFDSKSGELNFISWNASGFYNYAPITVKCKWNADNTLNVFVYIYNGMSVLSGDFIETNSSWGRL